MYFCVLISKKGKQMKTFFVIATILLLIGSIQLTQDKCPTDQGYPEGNWYCWAIECPGHQYKIDGLGCKTTLLGQISKALLVRAGFSPKS